jgi:uncharacterized protein (TIGR02145 family)
MKSRSWVFLVSLCSILAVSFGTGCGTSADFVQASAKTGRKHAEGVVRDGDGNEYRTVQIGRQIWMAENLRTSVFTNGDRIPLVTSEDAWVNEQGGAMWCVYENNNANQATYGSLYNFAAVLDGRGLCPTGWHVPTDKEWNSLIKFLGGQEVAGEALKAAPTGALAWDGSNTSGFSALPGGMRSASSGYFFNNANMGYWWTSSLHEDYAWSRILLTADNDVEKFEDADFRYGLSVRCVRD